MPNYALTCSSETCAHQWEQFAHMSQRAGLTCPKCGAKHPNTNFQAVRPPSVPHDWMGDEARSLKLSFDPSGHDELKKEVPSIEIGKSGDVYFRNDRHQKRVWKEIAATTRRYEEEAQARLDRRKATREDISEAVAAVRKFRERPATSANRTKAGAGT